MKYTLLRRKMTRIANSNKEFVNWMRKHDMQYFKDNYSFMIEYSHRKKTFENVEFNSENEDIFVEDLIKNGYLAIEETKINFLNLFKFNFR